MGKRQTSQQQLQWETKYASVFPGVGGAIALLEIGVKAELWYTVWEILKQYPYTPETISMDEQLCQLIQEIVRSEDASPQQQEAMETLLKLIPRLPSIYKYVESSLDYQDALIGRLPSAPDIPEALRKWQREFREKVKNSPIERSSRSRAQARKKTQSSNSDSAQTLANNLDRWLRSSDEQWQKIRDGILQQLNPDDEIRVIIQTENIQLRQLPWSVWDLFVQRYKKSEIALSSSEYRASGGNIRDKKVRILAVLGNSDNLNIQFDRQVLVQLPGAEIEFLEQPMIK